MSDLLQQHQAYARAYIRRIELADRIRLLRTVDSAELHFSKADFADLETLLRGTVQPTPASRAAIVEECALECERWADGQHSNGATAREAFFAAAAAIRALSGEG